MGYIDYYGNVVQIDEDKTRVDDSFTVKKILIPAGEKVEFPGDGTYYANPMSFSSSRYDILFYDEDGEVVDIVGDLYTRTDIHTLDIQQRYWMKVNGTTIEAFLVINQEEFDDGLNHGSLSGEFTNTPKYIKTSYPITYNMYSYENVSADKIYTLYNDDVSDGLLEQIYDSSAENLIDDIESNDEHGRRLRSNMIYTMNKNRHALRLATFNIATTVRDHWYVLKPCLEEYGIDICGMQEVRYPLTTEPTLVDYFTGWAFPYVSDNGDAYRHGDEREGLNERNLLSRIPIDSTVEYELTMGTDYRYVAKSVLSLPRYMDKRGSENLKLSVYNFQLEVSGTNAQLNADEVLEIVAEDDNPFIILMGDTNDFSIDKVVWQKFENAGFKPVLTTNTSTVSGTYDYNSIDNFFLSSRITALDYDVINAQNYPWFNASGHHDALSDHDLVIADVVLDYSDIRCVNYNLTNVSASASKTWLTDEETLTITLVPDSGYSLGTITVKDCMIQNDEAIIVSGNTITLDGSKLIGDVLITCSGVSS